MRTLLLLLCLTSVGYSCGSGPGLFRKKNGNLTARYIRSTTSPVGTNIKDYVRVGAFFYKEPEPPTSPARKRLVADLPSNALTEFIKQVGGIEKVSEKIVTQLNAGIGNRPPVVEEFIDLTQFSKRLVISIKNLIPGEANRIAKVEVQVCFPKEFRLLSCNRFETQFESVDLGKLNFNRGLQAKVGANLSTGVTGGVTTVSGTKLVKGTGSDEFNTDTSETSGNTTTTSGDSNSQGVNAEVGVSRSFAEEVALRQKRIVLNAMVENNSLFLLQRGTSGINLEGNVIADIIFDNKTNVAVERTYDFTDLADTDGKFAGPNKIKVTDVLIAYPNITGDLDVDITFEAEYRQVKSGDGDATTSESDDVVLLKYGATDDTTKKTVRLMTEDEYKPPFWVITSATTIASNRGAPIPVVNMVNPATGPGGGAILFNSYTMAKNFLIWLKAQKFGVTPSASVAIGTGGHSLRLNSGGTFSQAILDDLLVSIRR